MLIEVLSVAVMLAASPPVIVNPSWRRQPSEDEVVAHYPTNAAEALVAGKVVMNCRVSIEGRLNNCEVVSEDPEGYGFGAAALGLAGLMEMNPQTVGGMPVVSRVRVPIQFSLPEPEVMTYEETLDYMIQCFGVLGAQFDADPTRQVLIPPIDGFRMMALDWAVDAGSDADTVRARLDAAREAPDGDAAFGRMCLTNLGHWISEP